MSKLDLKIDEGRIAEDLVTTGYYVLSNTGYFDRSDFNSMLVLGDTTLNLYGKCLNFDDIRAKKPELFKKYSDTFKLTIDEFYDFICNNNDLLLALFTNAKKMFEEIDLVDFCYYDCFRGYSKEDFKKLVLDFYASYSDKYYKIAKKYFDENRIQTNYFGEDFLGFFINSKLTKSGYILLVPDKADSFSASILVHELGHAINAEEFIFPQMKRFNMFSDVHSEVPSTCFEKLFSSWIINNKIDNTGGLILNNGLYNSINGDSTVNSLFLSLGGYAYDLKNGELFYEVVDSGEVKSIDIRKNIIYGLGRIFSLYFQHLDNKDRKEFLKAYNNFITTKSEASLESLINLLGVKIEDFVDFKYVKDDIKDDTLKLKKRFNYYS